ncbi:hypothetical protein B0I35DRAFT_449279 [Stachybotrys elegans]|uniref:Actin-like ATPase domain-containing protein n=1 Tax=Stachybotrys elegans TaxID=80388 RepID=A0A8K0SYG6_9HYPO|nr:hypothetical protein B0I35DRAFT_449279 [Stachybotrys elegans]
MAKLGLLSISDTVSDDNDDDILVIGIDFGTTFSGVAWATAADWTSGDVNIITSWPGTGREEGKVPTEIFYEDGEMSWGYLVPPDGDPVRWFKLLLVKEEDLEPRLRSSEFVLRARQFLRVESKTAVDLVTDYLRALWAHVLATITKARGQAVVDALRFHVVITVPAIWKGYARQEMRQAAANAGMLDFRLGGETILSFAPEPEAAALSTLCEPGRKVTKGDVFMVCDAGGGTVDLITYKITGPNPVRMEEAVEGTGGLCGGIFVDQAFEIKCHKCLGRRWDHLSKNDINDVLREDWERGVKPQFTPSLERDYPIRVPAAAFRNGKTTDAKCDPPIKNARMMFTANHVKEIFSTVLKDIDNLVDEQIKGAKGKGLSVNGIILVGGFGASPYLYEHLRDRFQSSRIDILQSGGMRPRTAICRGAVYKGFLDNVAQRNITSLSPESLPIKVTSTISRASYGYKFQCPFVAGTHEKADMRFDENEDRYMADNQMQWYLKRGDESSNMGAVRNSWYRTYRSDPGHSITEWIYECDEQKPPSRGTDSVNYMCSITWKPTLPFSKWKDFKNPKGEMLKRVNYVIEMIPSGATLEFNVYVDGQKMGASSVAVNFQ